MITTREGIETDTKGENIVDERGLGPEAHLPTEKIGVIGRMFRHTEAVETT